MELKNNAVVSLKNVVGVAMWSLVNLILLLLVISNITIISIMLLMTESNLSIS